MPATLAILLAAGLASAVGTPHLEVELPEAVFAELLSADPRTLLRVRHALVEYGAFAVSHVPQLQAASERALEGLAQCAGPAAPSELRRTVAARTLGGVAEALDVPACEAPLRRLRAATARAAGAILAAVDGGPGGPPAMARAGGGEYAGLRELAAAGEQLEHFHLYPVPAAAPPPNRTVGAPPGEWTLPLHTDSGLLAVMTVGRYFWRADGRRPVPAEPPEGAGLYLRLRAGGVARVAQSRPELYPTSGREEEGGERLLVLAGEGAARWLGAAAGAQPWAPLRAAPHALLVGGAARPPPAGWGADAPQLVRAWHGRMLLPPADALVRPDSGGALLPYGAQRLAQAAQLANASESRRRLKTARLASPAGGGACLLSGGRVGVRCWTVCMEASDLPCGADRAVCYDTVTQKAVDGGKMCPSQPMASACELRCQVPPAPSPSPPPPAGADGGSGFCVGPGVTMFMDGFASSLRQRGRAQCVALFYRGWVLDSGWKFGAGCVGCALLGVAVEGLARIRQWLRAARCPRFAVLACHGLQLCVAYLLMLGAMAYSIELFASIVLGLTAGHALLSDGGALESAEPCCAPNAHAAGRELRGPLIGRGHVCSDKDQTAAGGAVLLPGGATPSAVRECAPECAAQDQGGAVLALAVRGMVCGACVARVEAALRGALGAAGGGAPGEVEVAVQLAAGRAELRGEWRAVRALRAPELVRAVRALGYECALATDGSGGEG